MNKDLRNLIGISALIVGSALYVNNDAGSVEDGDPRMNRVIEAAYNTNKLDYYYTHFTNRLDQEGIKIKPNKEIKLQLASNLDDELGWAGVSLGFEDDDIVWIIVDERVLDVYNDAEMLDLMYHELAHDLLNEDHTSSGLMSHSGAIPEDMQEVKTRINEFFKYR